MLSLELPGLRGGALRQRPLRFAKGLGQSLAPLALAAAGLRHSILHRIDRRHRAGTGPSGGVERVLLGVKTFRFWQGVRDSDRFVSGKTTRDSSEGFWQPGYLSQRTRARVRRLHPSRAFGTSGGRCSKSCPTAEEVIVDKLNGLGKRPGRRSTTLKFWNSGSRFLAHSGLGRQGRFSVLNRSTPRSFVYEMGIRDRNGVLRVADDTPGARQVSEREHAFVEWTEDRDRSVHEHIRNSHPSPFRIRPVPDGIPRRGRALTVLLRFTVRAMYYIVSAAFGALPPARVPQKPRSSAKIKSGARTRASRRDTCRERAERQPQLVPNRFSSHR